MPERGEVRTHLVLLDVEADEAVLDLDKRDRMDSVRAADRLGRDLAEADVVEEAFVDQLLQVAHLRACLRSSFKWGGRAQPHNVLDRQGVITTSGLKQVETLLAIEVLENVIDRRAKSIFG
jgi:hypothetical protein